MKVRGLFEELADTQDIMTTEMPNDFRATLAIQQGEIVLVAGLEKEECPLYCGECIDQKGQPDEFGVYVDDEHSCSHMDGEYDYIDKFWLGAMKFNEFEDRPDWGSWDISGLAHQHRTERKLGVRNEELKLQELEIGDVIRIVAGEEEKNRYIYEFDVKSAGIEPTVTFKQTGPDGNVVSLEDFEIILRGSGNWVGREWPLFRYSAGNHKQILIDYGTLHVGGDIVLSDPNRPRESRQVTLTPAISAIQLKRGARQWDFPE